MVRGGEGCDYLEMFSGQFVIVAYFAIEETTHRQIIIELYQHDGKI